MPTAKISKPKPLAIRATTRQLNRLVVRLWSTRPRVEREFIAAIARRPGSLLKLLNGLAQVYRSRGAYSKPKSIQLTGVRHDTVLDERNELLFAGALEPVKVAGFTALRSLNALAGQNTLFLDGGNGGRYLASSHSGNTGFLSLGNQAFNSHDSPLGSARCRGPLTVPPSRIYLRYSGANFVIAR
jgi:hypothetical protein